MVFVLANAKHSGMVFQPSPSLRPLPLVLQSHGYTTAAFVSATPVKKGTGIEAGFDHFDEPDKPVRQAKRTSKAAIDWMQRARNRCSPAEEYARCESIEAALIELRSTDDE